MKGAFRITDKILKWLEIKGWTQQQLATELNCDPSFVSQWFDQKNPKHPSWQMLKKLCLLTGLDVGDLLTLDRDVEQEEKD